ncbi:MAG: DNA cytosine methyltransferase [Thiothrix sp.]
MLQGGIGKPPSAPASGITDLFGKPVEDKRRYRKLSGMNDFFLFNDIRNGPTTIHSWDLLPTTDRQKQICLLLLRNRRKRTYGKLDGNPLSLAHLQGLDSSIRQEELETLVAMGILKTVDYAYTVNPHGEIPLTHGEKLVLRHVEVGEITLDSLKECRELKKAKVALDKTIPALVAKGVLARSEVRYEFRYTKISTGIEGINRIFLPKSEAFPTLVASDTNDFVAFNDIEADTEEAYKQTFLRDIFQPGLFRKISRAEACLIQGFPPDFLLPEARSRWMKLVGNSVSVPVIQMLGQAIIATGCFGDVAPCKAAA